MVRRRVPGWRWLLGEVRWWDGHEELDVRSEGGNEGLRGERDLFPAIGVFGGVDFDVFFHPSSWLYTPV